MIVNIYSFSSFGTSLLQTIIVYLGAWKTPIRVTQEIYEKFKSSPLKRLMPLKRKLSDPKPGEPTLKKKKPENEITTGSSLDAILDDVVKGVDCEPKKGPFIRFSNIPNSAELGKVGYCPFY